MTDGTPSLLVTGLSKSYPGVEALRDVRLEARAGEVMALLGENGAGKSTFVKILTGVEHPDRGEIVVDGTRRVLASPADAQSAGIVAIYQEPTMFDDLSVVENLFVDQLPTRGPFGLLDWPAMRTRAAALLAPLNLNVDVSTPLSTLSLAQKHLVSMAKALSRQARVIILDEPTAALSRQEIDDLFGVIRALKADGKTIIFISHKFDEIFEIADRYTIFRDGAYIAHGDVADTTQRALIEMMVGRSLDEVFPKAEVEIGGAVMMVTDLAAPGEFEGVSFALNRSEILGFYGLVGAGRSEVMQAIFGLRDRVTGAIVLEGAPYVPTDPAGAIARGIYYISEDRQRDGVLLDLPIRRNVALPVLHECGRGAFVSPEAEFAVTRRLGARLEVRTSSWMQHVGELSGGNQQKVAIGMGLATGPKIVILDEPTRGIDIASKAAVHAFIGQLVREGLSVILVSSELEEILGMSDRIVVMHRGRVRETFKRTEARREAILAEAAGA